MEHSICAAIRDRQVVQFSYKGAVRRVEPHTLGIDSKGHTTLCGWQLSGGSGQAFRDFHLDIAASLVVLDETFEGPRPGYSRDDKTLQQIICQL